MVFGITQTEINVAHHQQLLSFLFKVAVDQKLHHATISLTFHLLDQIFAKFFVKRKSCILVAAACLTLASKLEEIYPICVDTLLHHCRYNFTRDALFSMEKRILKKLSFDLTFPTRYQFLKQFAHSARLTQKQVKLAIYLVLLSHIDYNLNYIAASKLAAAIIHYVLQLTKPSIETKVWNKFLTVATRYSESDLIEPILRVRYLHAHIYDHGHMQIMIDSFAMDDAENVSEITALNYSDIRIDGIILPKREGDFQLIERAELKKLDPSLEED